MEVRNNSNGMHSDPPKLEAQVLSYPNDSNICRQLRAARGRGLGAAGVFDNMHRRYVAYQCGDV